jgi:zinc and cadmium transporter
MTILSLIIIFSLLGSAGAVGGAALLLVFPERVRKTLVPSLISYATGTLLGAAFLGMIPYAIEHTQASSILATILIGIVLFFLLEKLVIWRHCHDGECEIHGTAGPLILFGDAFHNFVDGVVIAAAFLISIPLGVATALAVIAHEVPQEIGDFAILLDSGYSRQKAFLYNLLSSSATLPAAVISYFSLKATQAVIPYILALSAASFIYIAMADLIPELHKRFGVRTSVRQFILFILGIGTILFFRLNHN